MKLRKDKWDKVKLESIFKLKSGNSLPAHKIVSGDFPVYGGNGIVGYHNEFMVDDPTIVIGRVGEYCGSIHLSKPKSWITDNGLYPVEYFKEIDTVFLKDNLSYANLNGYARKTGQPSISQSSIANVEIPLPPLSEQKQIAALFQSIETAMEQVDGQEKNLKALWKRLIDEFVSDKPSFGNLLKGKKLKTYNYCDVTEKLMRRIDPLTYGIERIVAGENLESEDFKIRTWQKVGEGYLGPAFHVLFKAGDILYGSRRTYLRKVSLADFDGVCANTTYVIRAKEDLLLQDLLKHIMLSERFTQYSIGVSKGSTNPYINWKDLDNFSFQVPDIETQGEIVKVLDGILEIVEQLKQQKTTLKLLKQKLLNEILG
jgi:type I restriction enzyme S subunit